MTEVDERLAHLEEQRRIASFNTDLAQAAMEYVFIERRRQVELGRSGKIPYACEDPDTAEVYRLGVLGEEYGEVCTAIIERKGPGQELEEYIHTAAVALACIEGMMRKLGTKVRNDGMEDNDGMGEVDENNYVRIDALADSYTQVLMECEQIYQERGKRRGELWRRQGWRGQLFNMRTCMERAWEEFWAAEPQELVRKMEAGELDDDNLLDLINYTVFCIVLVRSADRDGLWEYPQ
jgi:hypothetical protein